MQKSFDYMFSGLFLDFSHFCRLLFRWMPPKQRQWQVNSKEIDEKVAGKYDYRRQPFHSNLKSISIRLSRVVSFHCVDRIEMEKSKSADRQGHFRPFLFRLRCCCFSVRKSFAVLSIRRPSTDPCRTHIVNLVTTAARSQYEWSQAVPNGWCRQMHFLLCFVSFLSFIRSMHFTALSYFGYSLVVFVAFFVCCVRAHSLLIDCARANDLARTTSHRIFVYVFERMPKMNKKDKLIFAFLFVCSVFDFGCVLSYSFSPFLLCT